MQLNNRIFDTLSRDRKAKFGETLLLEHIHSDFQQGQSEVKDADQPGGYPDQKLPNSSQFVCEDQSKPDDSQNHEYANSDGKWALGKIVKV